MKTSASAVTAAALLSEMFHGRPPEEITEVIEEIREHGALAELGALERFEVRELGETESVFVDFDNDVKLSSNPEGTQLFVRGGDQSIDLSEFDVDPTKECVVLGSIIAVTYTTDKQHLNEEDRAPGPYRHGFGKKQKRYGFDTNVRKRPLLLYDTVNELVSVAGGVYVIQGDMDGGQHSAGIRH